MGWGWWTQGKDALLDRKWDFSLHFSTMKAANIPNRQIHWIDFQIFCHFGCKVADVVLKIQLTISKFEQVLTQTFTKSYSSGKLKSSFYLETVCTDCAGVIMKFNIEARRGVICTNQCLHYSVTLWENQLTVESAQYTECVIKSAIWRKIKFDQIRRKMLILQEVTDDNLVFPVFQAKISNIDCCSMFDGVQCCCFSIVGLRTWHFLDWMNVGYIGKSMKTRINEFCPNRNIHQGLKWLNSLKSWIILKVCFICCVGFGELKPHNLRKRYVTLRQWFGHSAQLITLSSHMFAVCYSQLHTTALPCW